MFPSVSETFVINQVADLLERQIDVQVFSFRRESQEHVSDRYYSHNMQSRTHYLVRPTLSMDELVKVARCIWQLLMCPLALLRITRFCLQQRSLRRVCRFLPFAGRQFDVIHCHFGDQANLFFTIKDVLKIEDPIITTFYGYDVSKLCQATGWEVYDRLKREGELFFVMSENMKRRVVQNGFAERKVVVLPVSIDVDSYSFCERRHEADQPVQIVSVARFVEKKGVDDVLRALHLIRHRTEQAFHCTIVGSGELEAELRQLRASLSLDRHVTFKGFMKIEDILTLFPRMHFMVQASKTASDGDME